MKPEIAPMLFLPLLEVLRESNIPQEKWGVSESFTGNSTIERNSWIDDQTFRGLISSLVRYSDSNKLIKVGEEIWASESIGLGDLLIPFVTTPDELFSELAEQINLRTRTFHIQVIKTDKTELLVSLTAKAKYTGDIHLCLWLEGILAAAKSLPFGLVATRCSCIVHDDIVEENIRLLPLEKNIRDDLPVKECSYLVRWKKPFFSRGRKADDDLKKVRTSLIKARDIIHQQASILEQLQTKMSQQEDLLKGIVLLSESSKAVKSFRELINLTATRICSDFGFDRSQIYLAKDDKLEIEAVIDPTDPTWAQQVYAVSQANPIRLDGRTEESRAFQTGRPVVVNNPWGNIFVPQAQLAASKSKAYLIVPMRGAERMIGIMIADHYYKKQTIEAYDVDKLVAVANISGLAIDKLRLIDRLETKVAERTSELQRANKKLMTLYEKARESDQMKSEFLANMSHELRTPLNSIIGFSKVILRGIDGPLTEKQQMDLEAILNSGTHLLGLINDILDLSKIESGKMELSKEHFDLNELVNQVAATSEGLVKEKPIRLVKNIDTEMPPIFADKIRLRQVLLNLLSNAIKFTVKGKITVTTKMGDKEFYVAVTDTGKGIPADKIDQAFEQFRQLDSGTARLQGGSGLGLTISKKFVEMHGGRIWVSSTEGIGSTFHFAIPMTSQVESEKSSLVETK